jgi:hypothetical protein
MSRNLIGSHSDFPMVLIEKFLTRRRMVAIITVERIGRFLGAIVTQEEFDRRCTDE